MKHAVIVPAVVRLQQVASVVLKVALQVDNMARRVAMVLRHLNNMVVNRVDTSSKVDKVATVVPHHRNHSMAVSSSTEVSSNSMEVEGMVKLPHSLLATRCDRKERDLISSGP